MHENSGELITVRLHNFWCGFDPLLALWQFSGPRRKFYAFQPEAEILQKPSQEVHFDKAKLFLILIRWEKCCLRLNKKHLINLHNNFMSLSLQGKWLRVSNKVIIKRQCIANLWYKKSERRIWRSGWVPSVLIMLRLHASLFTLFHAVQTGVNDCLRAAGIHVPHTAVKTLRTTSSSVHETANEDFKGGCEWCGYRVLCKNKRQGLWFIKGEDCMFLTLNNKKVFVHISSSKQKAVTGTARLAKCQALENDFRLNCDEQNIPRGRHAQSAVIKQFIRCSPALPAS